MVSLSVSFHLLFCPLSSFSEDCSIEEAPLQMWRVFSALVLSKTNSGLLLKQHRLGSMCFSGAWWLGNEAKLRAVGKNLSPDVFNKPFVSQCIWGSLGWSPELPSVIADADFIWAQSPEADPRFPLTLKNLRFSLVFSSLQWSVFICFSLQHGSSRIPFFLTYWSRGRRKGRCIHTRRIHN